MLMTLVLQLCSMDFFDTDSMFDEMFGFRETPAFQTIVFKDGSEKSGFADAGYDSSNFFQLIGPIFFFVVFFVVFVIVKKLIQLMTLKCSENSCTKCLRR